MFAPCLLDVPKRSGTGRHPAEAERAACVMSPQVHRSYTPRQPRKRADPAWPPVRATRGAAPATAGRPARGTAIRMPCRHASRSAAGRATRRQPPWARELPENPSIHQAPPRQQIGTQTPAALLAHRRRQSRHSRPGASARLSSACEAGMGTPRPLSVAVREKPTVRTDRPGGPDAVRYTSVDTATHRPAVTHPDTRRDKRKQPAGRVSAASGPFTQVVAGVGFEPT